MSLKQSFNRHFQYLRYERPFLLPFITLSIFTSSLSLQAIDAETEENQLKKQPVSITFQPLKQALVRFTAQTGIQIIYAPQYSLNTSVSPFNGSYTIDEALNRLLTNTPYAYIYENKKTVRLVLKSSISTEDRSDQKVIKETPNQKGIEELVITGSRIGRLGFDAKTPVTVLSSDYVQLRGFQTAAAPISQLPGFFLSSDIGGDTNNGATGRGRQFAANLGQSFPNALGLGTNRTLTLINGRRVVSQNSPLISNTETFRDREGGRITTKNTISNSAPGQQVDLNTIPSALIDRIEVVFTGGTPAYGADAVAGTVNVILKDDFEGFEFLSQYGISGQGDTESKRFQATWGQKFAKNKGNIALSFEYTHEDGLFIEERPNLIEGFAICLRRTGNFDVRPETRLELCKDAIAEVGAPNTGLITQFGSFPSFAIGDPPLIIGLDGGVALLEEVRLGPLNPEPTSQFRISNTAAEGTRVTQNPFFTFNVTENQNLPTILALPQERFSTNTIGYYELSETIKFNFEASYTHSSIEGEDPRPPLSRSRTGGMNFAGTGQLPINPRENPFISTELKQELIKRGLFDPDNPDDQTLGIRRSNVDIVGGRGRARNFRKQGLFRSSVSLKGNHSLWGHPFEWDISYVFGQSTSHLREEGINNTRYLLAVDAIRSPDTGQIICRSQIEETDAIPLEATPDDIAACTPINIFGFDQFSSEARDYIFQENTSQARFRQHIGEINLQTHLFSVPAGEVSTALGYHYRWESAFARPIQTLFTGLGSGAITSPVNGHIDTHDLYGEIIIPIVRNSKGIGDQTLIANFDIEGASRLSNHSNAGSDFSFTIGTRLNLNLPFIRDAITFRGQYAEAIRSPGLTELFAPRRSSSIGIDPCTFPDFIITENGCQSQIDALIAAGSLPEGFTFGNDGIDLVPVFIQGNPDLRSEQSRSHSLGIIFQPGYIPGLNFALDWTDIRLTDIIGIRSIATTCSLLKVPDLPVCSLIERDPNTFRLSAEFSAPINTNDIRKFSGITANLNYSFPLKTISEKLVGDLSIQGIFFYGYRDILLVEFATAESGIIRTREERLSELGGGRRRYSINSTYSHNRFTSLLEWRHISGAGNSKTPINQRASSTDLFNLTLQYRFWENLTGQIIINDIFDNRGDAPFNQANGIIANPVGRNFIFSLTVKL
jgi:outer membrane receptor protein involved in Fe transport